MSPEYFELERERIFRRHWINVGRVDEVAENGHYFVRELDVCKVSVLVVRGNDGALRAFHNVCPHRGNTLVLNQAGKCPGRFGCGFHSWAFSPEGELAFVPDEENFFDLDKSRYGLSPIHCETWEGFIFINLAPAPEQNLREFLGGVATQLDGAGVAQMQRIRILVADQSQRRRTLGVLTRRQHRLLFGSALQLPIAQTRKQRGEQHNRHRAPDTRTKPALCMTHCHVLRFWIDSLLRLIQPMTRLAV